MSDTSSSDRITWMDVARVIAAFWVVTIHVAAVPVVHMQAVPLSWWWWGNVYNCFSRAAVPMFVMISGALLLTSPSYETGRFFRRRAVKLLPPLVGWTVVYELWRIWLRHEQIGAGEFLRNVFDGLNTPAYPHLWFLWIIASLYLLTPLLQPFVMRAARGTQLYVGVLWFVTTALLPLLQRWAGWHVGLLIQMPSFGYVGYYLAGAMLCQGLPWSLSERARLACVVVFLACWALSAWGTYTLSVAASGRVDESLMEPLSGTVMLMSLSAFLLIRHHATAALAGEQANKVAWRKRFGQLSALSFGVYLAHPLMLDLLDLLAGLPLDPLPHNPAWYVPLVALLAFALAAALTALMRRLPLLQRLVP